MNKKIILHIGLYKTGSTFIQEHLGKVENDNFQIFLPRGKLVEHLLDYLNNPREIIRNKILAIINECKNNIIISSEGIFGHQSNGFINVLKRMRLLESLFDRPNYIIFFREPSSIIYSGFFQGLKKNFDLKFQNYIYKNINDLHKTIPKDFSQTTNYKIFDYNKIFCHYLNIKERALFVEYEKFFKEKNVDVLNNFIGLDIFFNFEEKINFSLKKLIYLEFYNKFFLFKYIKIFWLALFRVFLRFKKTRDPSSRLIVLINVLIKITPKIYLKKIEDKHQHLLDEIRNYHSKNYEDFKKKIVTIK